MPEKDKDQPCGVERRFVNVGNIELRVEGDGDARKFRGHAAIFDSRSEDLGGFVEVIEPGFFDNVMSDDVRGLFNHNADNILGRTSSGTMRIAQDAKGLSFEIDHPGTTFAEDLEKSIRRGDITGASFAFSVRSGFADWKELEDGTMLRTLKRGGAKRLYDAGPVTYPAYSETDASVAKRSLDAWRSEQDEPEEERAEAPESDEESKPDHLDLDDRARELSLFG